MIESWYDTNSNFKSLNIKLKNFNSITFICHLSHFLEYINHLYIKVGVTIMSYPIRNTGDNVHSSGKHETFNITDGQAAPSHRNDASSSFLNSFIGLPNYPVQQPTGAYKTIQKSTANNLIELQYNDYILVTVHPQVRLNWTLLCKKLAVMSLVGKIKNHEAQHSFLVNETKGTAMESICRAYILCEAQLVIEGTTEFTPLKTKAEQRKEFVSSIYRQLKIFGFIALTLGTIAFFVVGLTSASPIFAGIASVLFAALLIAIVVGNLYVELSKVVR